MSPATLLLQLQASTFWLDQSNGTLYAFPVLLQRLLLVANANHPVEASASSLELRIRATDGGRPRPLSATTVVRILVVPPVGDEGTANRDEKGILAPTSSRVELRSLWRAGSGDDSSKTALVFLGGMRYYLNENK